MSYQVIIILALPVPIGALKRSLRTGMSAVPASGGSFLLCGCYGHLLFAPYGSQRTGTAPQQSCSAGDPAMSALPVRAAYSTRRNTSGRSVLKAFPSL
jgi:hypothetical protein